MHSVVLPTVDGASCNWILPARFTEEYGLTTMGNLDTALAQGDVSSCRINMAHVEWADPMALLFLAGSLGKSTLRKKAITVDLGRDVGKIDHLVFLKFLAKQGFLRIFSEYTVLCNGLEIIDIPRAIRSFSMFACENLYQNADCIHAKIIDVHSFATDSVRLHDFVERLIREAHKRAIDTAFGANPFARDRLFQKTRKLIYELTLNVAEHAYDHGPRLMGIYARIREPKPMTSPQATEWQQRFNATVSETPGLKQFQPNPFSEWLELFICDLGRGLTADVQQWRSSDPQIQARLRKAAKKHKPLESLYSMLFREPLSRMPRHDTDRTPVTGLQHLGHILAFGNDYGRVYADGGTWVGYRHPWETGIGSITSPAWRSKDGRIAAAGTAFAFYIQPALGKVEYPEGTWAVADEPARRVIIDALRTEEGFDPNGLFLFFDRHNEKTCLPQEPEDKDSLEFQQDTTIIVCPPRLVTKQELGQWVGKLAGRRNQAREWAAATLIIAELTPFQALMFAEFFKSLPINQETSQFDVYLVSEQWAVACLTSGTDHYNRKRLVPALDKARLFLLGKGDSAVSAAGLAKILRDRDSEVFWQNDNDSAPASTFFRNAPVQWTDTVRLSRYMDLSHALLEPDRYRACRRALRRCLELYQDEPAVPSDDLVASLVKDAAAGTFRQPSTAAKPTRCVVVGSVCVTADTVGRFKRRSDLTVVETIHLLVHVDAAMNVRQAGLKALRWMDPDIPRETESGNPRRALARIPHTPYVAEGGERALSVVRFRRENGALDFSQPLYGRSPDEMYREFRTYGALKLGHWSFGRRHDLLTVNSRFAFEYSALEKGDLHRWLERKFTELFLPAKPGKKALAQLLIYPSHAVTDEIIKHIKEDETFKLLQPAGGIYPIRFLGAHTVSPVLPSPMIANQIKSALIKGGWKPWSAVIFDDATISGKHMRELTQFLHELGAKLVYSIGIVDRTGLPVTEGAMTRFMERHHRYWRWDVPSLGHKRDCALCRALGISHTYADRLHSPSQSERLKMWREQWSAVDIGANWYDGGTPAVPLHKSFKMNFGVEIGPDGEKRGHSLHLSDSTSLASLLVELSRMTTRSDVALDRARMLFKGDDRIPPNAPAAIEVIASQLLLFLDEFDYWEKCERFCHLLQFMWGIAPESKITALSALCLTLVEEELIEDVWTYCQKNLLTKRTISNIDTVIVVNILLSLRRFWTKREYRLDVKASVVERQNYILLEAQPGAGKRFRTRLGDCFMLIGDRNGTSHITPFRENIGKIIAEANNLLERKNNDYTDIEKEKIRALTADIVQPGRRLIEIFDNTDLDILFVNNVEGLSSCVEKIRCAIDLLVGDAQGQAKLTDRQKGARELQAAIFGDANDSLRLIISRQFLREVKAGDLQSKFLGEAVMRVAREWNNIISEKMDSSRNNIWMSQGKSPTKPEISCGNDVSWDKSFSVYYDQLVRQAVHDALANVAHASGTLRNPWDSEDKRKAHMWWRAIVTDRDLMLEFLNASESRVVHLKPSLGIAGLERVGGSIATESAHLGSAIVTRLRIPLSTNFIGES